MSMKVLLVPAMALLTAAPVAPALAQWHEAPASLRIAPQGTAQPPTEEPARRGQALDRAKATADDRSRQACANARAQPDSDDPDVRQISRLCALAGY
ncbi:hypothetical protein IAI18_21335 [Acetobacteraceae bacterium H6797]|nr:hypothetical protein [Acetobacteraceae bacterium H6797]